MQYFKNVLVAKTFFAINFERKQERKHFVDDIAFIQEDDYE